jgi:hypothetical protein
MVSAKASLRMPPPFLPAGTLLAIPRIATAGSSRLRSPIQPCTDSVMYLASCSPSVESDESYSRQPLACQGHHR